MYSYTNMQLLLHREIESEEKRDKSKQKQQQIVYRIELYVNAE